ncbi:unnamed protein product [Prorocentrum cordatum]|uniref:Beta-lactamase-related domain-containing protein n=1 Tax=Prorocentrum cordatum TaxID=2364126 RepID=A0ABN9UIT8_9DINO|nr:unnamed protein product [Polarella glacialis]
MDHEEAVHAMISDLLHQGAGIKKIHRIVTGDPELGPVGLKKVERLMKDLRAKAADVTQAKSHETEARERRADVVRHCQEALDIAIKPNRGFGGGLMHVEAPSISIKLASGSIRPGFRQMDPSDQFEIASVTKTFVAALLLRVIELNMLPLHPGVDPANAGLEAELSMINGLSEKLYCNMVMDSEGVDRSSEVTLRMLLSHRNGFVDHWDSEKIEFVTDEIYGDENKNRLWSVQETMDQLRKHMRKAGVTGKWRGNDFSKLCSGKCYKYTDSAYEIIGQVIEVATGITLREAFRKYIYERVGIDYPDMYQTWREGPDEGLENRDRCGNPSLSYRYERDWPTCLTEDRRQSIEYASGGFVSDTASLHKFIQSLFSGCFFDDPKWLSEMRTFLPTDCGDISYGLGFMRIRIGNTDLLEGHLGHGNVFMFAHVGNRGVASGVFLAGTLNFQDDEETCEVGYNDGSKASVCEAGRAFVLIQKILKILRKGKFVD